jgi:hypothetical protein
MMDAAAPHPTFPYGTAGGTKCRQYPSNMLVRLNVKDQCRDNPPEPQRYAAAAVLVDDQGNNSKPKAWSSLDFVQFVCMIIAYCNCSYESFDFQLVDRIHFFSFPLRFAKGNRGINTIIFLAISFVFCSSTHELSILLLLRRTQYQQAARTRIVLSCWLFNTRLCAIVSYCCWCIFLVMEIFAAAHQGQRYLEREFVQKIKCGVGQGWSSASTHA